MASSGPNSGSSVSTAASGTQAWFSTGNVYASDNSRAYFDSKIGGGLASSYKLNVTGFGFTLPSSTIDGIVVEIERSADREDGSNYAFDSTIQLIIGGTETGDNKATATHWPTSDAYATYGGATVLWGLTPTYTQINGSDFGIMIIGSIQNAFSMSGYVDHCRITVYYTEAGGAAGGGSIFQGRAMGRGRILGGSALVC